MTPETRQQIEALLHAGHSDLDIHRQTGADRGTVRRYRQRLGLPGYRVTADSPACRYGHPFPENAVRGNDGWLRCRACMRASSRRAYQPRPRPLRGQTQPRVYVYVPVQPDESAIERAVAGDPPERLTPRERHAAIVQLDRWTMPAAAIAERVRCSQRTVYRARSKGAAA